MPFRFVSDVTPKGPQTDYKLRDIKNAANRLQQAPTVAIRSVDLSASLADWMQTNDGTVVFSDTASGATFFFQPARSMPYQIVNLVNEGTSDITLTPSGTDVIDDATLPAGVRYSYQSDGLNEGHWKRLSSSANTGVTSIHADSNPDLTGDVEIDSTPTIQWTQTGQILSAATTFFSGARVTHNAAQTISPSTPTILAFNTERYDTGAFHDNVTNNSRLTIPATDYYDVTVNVEWNFTQVGIVSYALEILLNGASLTSTTTVTTVGSVTYQYLLLENQLLAVTDYLQVQVTLTNGVHVGSVDINSHTDYSPMFAAKVRS